MTLVFLHGIGAGAGGFDLMRARLPGSIALNMPGFGAEPWRGPASFETLSNWLVEKLDALGIGRAVLFGHSFGGMLALETAVRHRDRVRGLVLCCTTPAFGGRDESFGAAFLKARLGPLDDGMTMAELGEKSAAQMMGDGADPAARALIAREFGATPEPVYRDIVRCLTTFDRRADLSAVDIPCLTLAGTADRAAPAKTVRRMAEALPNAVHHDIDCGHMMPAEAPEEAAALTSAFIQTACART
jgi:pimeloyl-ACP methyl ester carboxylesterase